MNTFRLQSGLIDLQLLSLEDADEIFALIEKNRVYLRSWMPWLDRTKTVSDFRNYVEKTLTQHEKKELYQWTIRYNGKIVGMIGYHVIDYLNRHVNIGYWLSEDFQGKGIMTTSCKLIIDFAFTRLGLNKVCVRCATGNDKSCAIPKRLGFTHEGILREDEWLYNHYVDLNVYSLLKREWSTK